MEQMNLMHHALASANVGRLYSMGETQITWSITPQEVINAEADVIDILASWLEMAQDSELRFKMTYTADEITGTWEV